MVLSPHPLENDPLQAMEQEEDLPKELLKHLEGIENDYEMVDSQSIPVDTRSLDQGNILLSAIGVEEEELLLNLTGNAHIVKVESVKVEIKEKVSWV